MSPSVSNNRDQIGKPYESEIQEDRTIVYLSLSLDLKFSFNLPEYDWA